MARPKSKESKSVNINMDVSVLARLEAYCEETGLPKTTAIERILKQYFDTINNDNQISK
jgi:antitoxin component of RelBE/YafQ-DinJ toxin-antitoxin module